MSMSNTDTVYSREVGDWTVAVEKSNGPWPEQCKVVVYGGPSVRSLGQQDTYAHGIDYANSVTKKQLERLA